MENNNIVLSKSTKGADCFLIILCIFAWLILIFQITADRHISKASRDFIEGERAKRIAAVEKHKKLLKEQELAAARMARQKEEEEHLSSMEAQMKAANMSRKARPKPSGMDYRDKLGIYNKAEAEAKAAVEHNQSRVAKPQGK